MTEILLAEGLPKRFGMALDPIPGNYSGPAGGSGPFGGADRTAVNQGQERSANWDCAISLPSFRWQRRWQKMPPPMALLPLRRPSLFLMNCSQLAPNGILVIPVGAGDVQTSCCAGVLLGVEEEIAER